MELLRTNEKEYIAFRNFIEEREYGKAYEVFSENPNLVSQMSFEDSVKYHKRIKTNIGKLQMKIHDIEIVGATTKQYSFHTITKSTV